MNPPFSILFPYCWLVPNANVVRGDVVDEEAGKKLSTDYKMTDWLAGWDFRRFLSNSNCQSRTDLHGTWLHTTESHDNWADTTDRWFMDRVSMPLCSDHHQLERSSWASELWLGMFVSVRNDLSLRSSWLLLSFLLRKVKFQWSQTAAMQQAICNLLSFEQSQQATMMMMTTTTLTELCNFPLSCSLNGNNSHKLGNDDDEMMVCLVLQQLLGLSLPYPINFC